MTTQDPKSNFNATGEELFRVRRTLEDLTRRYVEGLLSSHDSVDEQAIWLTSILEAIGDGLLAYDENRKLKLANQRSAELFGFDIHEESIVEKAGEFTFVTAAGEILHAPDELPAATAMREKRPIEVELLIKGGTFPPEGKWIRVNSSPVLSTEGNLVGGVTILNDVTERKQLLIQRDALAALITHDLKNHLASEQMFFELLHDTYAGRFSESELCLLSELQKNNQRYFDIVRTLLELHRTDLSETGASPTNIELERIVIAAVELNSHTASLQGVQIESSIEDGLPKLYASPSALQQVVHNLLQNAVHVSTAGQVVRVSARSTTHSVIIEVSDRGPGIPAQEAERLFSGHALTAWVPDTRVSSKIGLYLCRKLVEQQGGKISCSTELGSGTILSVEFPLASQRS